MLVPTCEPRGCGLCLFVPALNSSAKRLWVVGVICTLTSSPPLASLTIKEIHPGILRQPIINHDNGEREEGETKEGGRKGREGRGAGKEKKGERK